MQDDSIDAGRRRAIQRLAMSAGGLLLFPLVASGHPIQHHLRDDAAVGAADAKAAAAGYVPEFLDAHQFAALQLLAERIVPGSTKATSAEFIDQLLTVSSADDQRRFVQALGGFERLAIARAHASWTELTEAQQNELLTIAAAEQPRTAPDARATSPAPHVTIRDHFEHLKGWVVGAYYSSEPGMRELGWSEAVFHATFDGCEHADGH